MEASTNNRPQPLPSDRIVGRYEDADSSPKEVFEVRAPIGHSASQITSPRELRLTVRLIVIITMEHYLKAPFGDTSSQVFDERPVLV
jgi:hypothetical protein